MIIKAAKTDEQWIYNRNNRLIWR